LTVTRIIERDNIHNLITASTNGQATSVNDFNGIVDFDSGWTSNGALREWFNLTGRIVTWDNWSIFIQSNANTVDGAELEIFSGVTPSGLIIPIDQADGRLSNFTEQFLHNPLTSSRMLYTQGNNSCNIETHLIRNDMGRNNSS